MQGLGGFRRDDGHAGDLDDAEGSSARCKLDERVFDVCVVRIARGLGLLNCLPGHLFDLPERTYERADLAECMPLAPCGKDGPDVVRYGTLRMKKADGATK